MSSMWGLFGLFILVLLITTLAAKQKNPNIDIDKVLVSLNWSEIFVGVESANQDGTALTNVIYKFIDFAGYSAMEIGKLAITWGFHNVNLSWKIIMFVLIFSIAAPILLFLTKFIVIVVILVQDIISSLKEKRELRKLEKKEHK